jgi:hypothetical protein
MRSPIAPTQRSGRRSTLSIESTPFSMMKKSIPAANPDTYVAALSGWQHATVAQLRAAVRASAALVEAIKWGHLVYLSNGPMLLIRAEERRVLFGFWRGKRLCAIDPLLKPGGKYEMATRELHEGDEVNAAMARRLAREAVRLNKALGDPTQAAKRSGPAAMRPRRG